MTKYRPPSIKDIGLATYLDQTRDQHNGLGFVDFKQRIDLGAPKTKIAHDFGKSSQAVWHWVKIYSETLDA